MVVDLWSTLKLAGFYGVKYTLESKTTGISGKNGASRRGVVDNWVCGWGKHRGFLEGSHGPWYGLARTLHPRRHRGALSGRDWLDGILFFSCRSVNRRSLGVHSRLERSGCMATGKVKW